MSAGSSDARCTASTNSAISTQLFAPHSVAASANRSLAGVPGFALPGGLPARDVVTNHRPEPKDHGGLVVVGDYLFDSTLNGVLDSADTVVECIIDDIQTTLNVIQPISEPAGASR